MILNKTLMMPTLLRAKYIFVF